MVDIPREALILCYLGHHLNIHEIPNFEDHVGHIFMSYFENQKGLTISTNENKSLTFSIPTPEASPVLTLG